MAVAEAVVEVSSRDCRRFKEVLSEPFGSKAVTKELPRREPLVERRFRAPTALPPLPLPFLLLLLLGDGETLPREVLRADWLLETTSSSPPDGPSG